MQVYAICDSIFFTKNLIVTIKNKDTKFNRLLDDRLKDDQIRNTAIDIVSQGRSSMTHTELK